MSLFIKTPKTIQQHSALTYKTPFESSTHENMVNACTSFDNTQHPLKGVEDIQPTALASSLLAVADSQIILLCDAAHGTKKCALKSDDMGSPIPGQLDH
jgi:hypothetical protein